MRKRTKTVHYNIGSSEDRETWKDIGLISPSEIKGKDKPENHDEFSKESFSLNQNYVRIQNKHNSSAHTRLIQLLR